MLRRNTNYIIISFVLDASIILLSLLIAQWARVALPFGKLLPREPFLPILFWEAGLLYPTIFALFSIYDPERRMRAVDEYQLTTIASFVAGLSLAGLVYFTARGTSRLLLIYFYFIHFVLAVSWRAAAWIIRRRQNLQKIDLRRVLLIGGGEAARQALERLNQLSWAGIELVGYLTDGPPIPATNGKIAFLGGLDKIEELLPAKRIDDVLLALPAEEYRRVQQLVTGLIDKPCNIWIVQDYFSLLIYGGKVEDLGGVPMISLRAPTLSGYQRLLKRAMDLILGGALTLVFLPLMGLIALAIRLDSEGQVIFRQLRVGEGGRLFWIYKYRTMVADAERHLIELMKRNLDGEYIHKFPDDPRVTPIGKFLRRTSLDELPNLFNVLKGEMSLVGPRPELPILVEGYEAWQRKRLAVPQGITGWWQVNGRSDKPLHLHTEDDLYYIQNYSLLLDLQILIKTVWVVLRGRGAY